LQNKYKHIFWLVFKIVVAMFAFWFIYLKVKEFSFSDFVFPGFNFHSYFIFSIAVLLMPLNWLLETVKWKYLIRRLERITLLNAFKAVLSGISFAVISPNRIGELAGRVFILKNKNRGRAIFATAVGSLSQLMITLFIGLFSGVVVLFYYPAQLQIIDSEQLFYLKIVSFSVVVFGFLFLFNLKYLVIFIKKLKINIKFIEYIEVLSEYSKDELFKVLLLSLLRYLIFSLQFVLLLYFFNTGIPIHEAFIGIGLTYLVSSLVPVLSILEIGVRGTAAILFLGMFSENIPGILSATAVLWFINLAIPSVAGAFVFYRTKI